MYRKKSETFSVEYSAGKRKNYAQGRGILVEAYKNARMRVKERQKNDREKRKKRPREEESVDLAENREIVAFPLAACRWYLRAE